MHGDGCRGHGTQAPEEQVETRVESEPMNSKPVLTGQSQGADPEI